jgi:hypothetical protein
MTEVLVTRVPTASLTSVDLPIEALTEPDNGESGETGTVMTPLAL